jgi:hypothetical protein
MELKVAGLQAKNKKLAGLQAKNQKLCINPATMELKGRAGLKAGNQKHCINATTMELKVAGLQAKTRNFASMLLQWS